MLGRGSVTFRVYFALYSQLCSAFLSTGSLQGREHEKQFSPLFCSESSEVRIEDGRCGPDQCFLDDPVPGLLPGTITTRKGFQVLGHCWLRLHLLLGHQGDQACLRQQDQEEDQPFDQEKKCKAQSWISEQEISSWSCCCYWFGNQPEAWWSLSVWPVWFNIQNTEWFENSQRENTQRRLSAWKGQKSSFSTCLGLLPH